MEKNVLITGASKGLGLAVATSLLGKGWKVLAINRTATPSIQALAAENPGKFTFLPFDLSKPHEVSDFFKSAIGLPLPLHAFVNNAAIAYDDIITNLDLEALERMYRVNVFSPMMVTKNVIRNMILHQVRGSIVHVSSISAHTGYKGLSMYASTKGALEAFSKNTAREWGERGIRSNCVVAGFMDRTEMSAGLTPDQKERIYARTAMKTPTSVESVARTIEFLLDDGAVSITGQNIVVDSGTI